MPINIFDGSSWNPFKKIQIHNGSSWVDSKASYIWNGTEWKLFTAGVPSNTVSPLLSQTSGSEGSVDQTLSITTGTWDNSPTSYRYVWEAAPYSNSSYNWQPLMNQGVAQTQATAYLNSTYVGYLVRCKVYASNAVGESLPKIVENGAIYGPGIIPVFVAYPVSDGRIYAFWQKAKGVTGYILAYQGPNVPFASLTLPVNNEEPGTSVGEDYGNKYIELGSSASGTLFITLQPINESNPFTTAIGSRMIGRQSSVSLSTVRTSIAARINGSSLSGAPSQFQNVTEVNMSVSVASYGSPAGTLDYYWGPGSFWNGGSYALFDNNGSTISCTASITNSEGTVSSTAYYTLPQYVAPPPVISYGSCEFDYNTTRDDLECNGTSFRFKTTTTTYYKRKVLSDGSWTGQYNYDGCSTTSTVSYTPYSTAEGVCGYTAPPPCVCNYSTTPTMSFHFAPQSCPGGSQRTGSLSGTTVNANCPNVSKTATGTFTCSSYDVNNTASTNYANCYTVGACQAPRNPDGSRSACYS